MRKTIRQLREERGESTMQVARVLGITWQEVNDLETGVASPSLERLRGLTEHFGVDDTDKMRARYTREYYRRDWNDPVHFHMVLNTAALGLDGATEAVVGRARVLGWG